METLVVLGHLSTLTIYLFSRLTPRVDDHHGDNAQTTGNSLLVVGERLRTRRGIGWQKKTVASKDLRKKAAHPSANPSGFGLHLPDLNNPGPKLSLLAMSFLSRFRHFHRIIYHHNINHHKAVESAKIAVSEMLKGCV